MLIFIGTSAGNLTTIIVAAVKVGRWIYAYPQHVLNLTLQDHLKINIEDGDQKVKIPLKMV